MRKGFVFAGIAVVVAATLPFALPAAMRARSDNQIWHGMREAEEHGCFNCHAAPNNRELPNPGSSAETVPSFAGGNVMMYVDRPEEVREWIRDGVTQARKNDPKWQAEVKAQLIHMPAFGSQLDDGDIEALAAYVLAVDDYFSPENELAKHGEELARQQCMSCHNVGGGGGMPNPGSPFGYIPAFFGPDFHDLVHGEDELREWIKTGTNRRVAKNPLAGWFWKRQKIAMPAFGEHLSAGDLNALAAYIAWLGQTDGGTRPAASPAAKGAGR
jgi:mono/diheme cytochrome c family protein